MKELAFGRDNIIGDGIQPEPDIVLKKTADESQYFEVESTGARISMRDAKLLLSIFCKAAAEHH